MEITFSIGEEGDSPEELRKKVLKLLAAIERGDLEHLGVVAAVGEDGEEFKIPGAHGQLSEEEREHWLKTILEVKKGKDGPGKGGEKRHK